VNVLGFVPVGLVLGEYGVLRAVTAAALMSGLAETGQLVMLNRDSSVSDFIMNVVGALLGAILCAHWKIGSPAFRLNRWTMLVAAAGAFGLVAHIWIAEAPRQVRVELRATVFRHFLSFVALRKTSQRFTWMNESKPRVKRGFLIGWGLSPPFSVVFNCSYPQKVCRRVSVRLLWWFLHSFRRTHNRFTKTRSQASRLVLGG
jgi:hypothetical protein